MNDDVELISDELSLSRIINEASCADRLAVDLESNGYFAYRARLCTAQLAWFAADGTLRIAIVDTIALAPKLLAPLLEADRPLKVLHDLAYDARLLFDSGVRLNSVRDTAVASVYLGNPATGLASMLASELSVQISKEMRLSDWSLRPISEAQVGYLAGDVRYLLDLDRVLHEKVVALGIENEVATETLYRIESAYSPEVDDRPLALRVKHSEGLDLDGRAILEQLCDLRERVACERDVPPTRLLSDRLLVGFAVKRPTDRRSMRSEVPESRGLDDSLVDQVATAVVRALRLGPSKQLREAQIRPAFDRSAEQSRRACEKRISAWRKTEADRRSIHEQVVLPGHCLRRLASGNYESANDIARMSGLGSSRASLYAQTLAGLLKEPVEA